VWLVFEALGGSARPVNCPIHLTLAERSGKLLRLTLQQTVEAPLLSEPARLPECPKAGKLSKLLHHHINGTYGAMITGHLEVDTTYVQVCYILEFGDNLGGKHTYRVFY
jgi:hypothetical protein